MRLNCFLSKSRGDVITSDINFMVSPLYRYFQLFVPDYVILGQFSSISIRRKKVYVHLLFGNLIFEHFKSWQPSPFFKLNKSTKKDIHQWHLPKRAHFTTVRMSLIRLSHKSCCFGPSAANRLCSLYTVYYSTNEY